MYDETACIQDYGSQDPQKAQLEYQSLNEFKDEQERPSRPYLKGFLAGVILAALLVIILACAGVFSSGSSDDCSPSSPLLSRSHAILAPVPCRPRSTACATDTVCACDSSQREVRPQEDREGDLQGLEGRVRRLWD